MMQNFCIAFLYNTPKLNKSREATGSANGSSMSYDDGGGEILDLGFD